MFPKMNNRAFRRNRRNNRSHNKKKTDDEAGTTTEGKVFGMREPRPRLERIPKNQLKETDLGITEYTTPLECNVIGTIKSRYSDFLVNEIDMNESVVKLSNIAAPPIEEVKKPEDPKELESVRKGNITIENINDIKTLLESQDTPDNPIIITLNDDNKDTRTEIHKDLKAFFGGAIDANTNITEGIRRIEVRRSGKSNRSEWNHPHKFVHFVLYKENIDTVQAISALAQSVRTRPGNFNYAGTKDKRAKTTQWVSVKQIEPARLVKATRNLNMVFVGNFKYEKAPIKLGMLKGNQFRIAIRDLNTSKEDVENHLQIFKEKGFINYYGTQRFGNSATVPTHEIGKALVKLDFNLACELIMKPREGDAGFIEEMRKKWMEDKDAKEARKLMPKFCTFVEAKLLDGYIRTTDTNHLGALNNLPRNMRMLYMHSYQSLLWNIVASKRIREMKMVPCEGDLVYVEMEDIIQEKFDSIYTQLEDDEEPEEEKSEENLAIKQNRFDEQAKRRANLLKEIVRPLKKDELHQYTIYDVVLPLVGHDVIYPENLVKQWYIDLLKSDELTLDDLKTDHKIFSLTGSYRKLLIKPQDLTWSFRQYEKPEENLIISDFQELRNETLPKEEGSHTSLIITLNLPPSTYATMALREILKRDTSPAVQAESFKRELSPVIDETSTESQAKKMKTHLQKKRRNLDNSLISSLWLSPDENMFSNL